MIAEGDDAFRSDVVFEGINDTLLYSSSHIPWRNSILFTEGVIEAGSMFKAAAEGDIVYAHFWVGFEQMASTLHLDIQNERGWRTARERNNLAMELSWTHAQLFCERIHVELLFVHKQIDMIHSLGEEAALCIRQLYLILLFLRMSGIVAKLVAQRALAVEQTFHYSAQLVHIERFG